MECSSPRWLSEREMAVPCGRCVFCLSTRRSDWSTRLNVEWRHAPASSFITLTYANHELTFKSGAPQLVKPDLQKWFKRVRKAGYRFRYYAVGEYGSQTFRPHYHILLFGDVPENVIRKAWGKGLVHVGKVSQASVSYCLKYVVNSKDWKMSKGRSKPFATMSRGRGAVKGIGSQYLTKAMVAWHRSGRKNYVMQDTEKRHLPKYYKDKIFSAIDKVRIANRVGRDSLENLRKELKRLGRYHSNPMEYREEMLKEFAKRVRDKTKQNLTI